MIQAYNRDRSWRAPSNSRGPSDAQRSASGFIDGDFLDRYLSYNDSSPELARVLKGGNDAEILQWSNEELRSLLEKLRLMY